MANSIQVATFYTKEMLRQVKNNLQFVKNVRGENFGGRFTETPKKGETINVRLPARHTVRSGETFSASDYVERSVPMTVQTTAGVDLSFTNRELMFNLDYVSERVIAPAAQTLANSIDTTALQLATQATANFVGTHGTIPTALKTYNQARAKIIAEGAPQDQSQILLVSPDMQVEIVDAVKGLFQSSEQIAKGFEQGILGVGAGAKWYECQNLYTHTVGPLGGTPLVNGANQHSNATPNATSQNLITDGWTASAASRLKKGDVFTIGSGATGVFAVNPWTGVSTGALRQFTVVSDVSSDGSGNLTAVTSPAIFTTGPYKNCSQAPPDNAAITVVGSASAAGVHGFRFHPEAFLFTTFSQPMPENKVTSQQTDPQTGITIRYIKDWDTDNNKEKHRFDVVWAFGVAYPQFACRVGSLT